MSISKQFHLFLIVLLVFCFSHSNYSLVFSANENPQRFFVERDCNSFLDSKKKERVVYETNLNHARVKNKISILFNGDLILKVDNQTIIFEKNIKYYFDNSSQHDGLPLNMPSITIKNAMKIYGQFIIININFTGVENSHNEKWTIHYTQNGELRLIGKSVGMPNIKG